MGDRLYKLRHRLAGLCECCSRKAEPGHIRCSVHLKNDRILTLKIKDLRIEQGRCRECGGPMEEPGRRCINCRTKIRTVKWREYAPVNEVRPV